MDFCIARSGGAQAIHVFAVTARRRLGEFDGIGEQRLVAIVQSVLRLVGEQRFSQFVGSLGTEVPAVGLGSVEAVVGYRHLDGHEFPEPAWQW